MTAAVAVALPMALLRVLTYQDAADPAGYVRMAGRSAGLLNAASPGGLYTLQPPIYPLTVTLYQTLGASTIDQHRVGGIALGLVLVLATIALSQRLFGTRVALTAGVISAISINMVNGDLNLYPETLASIWLVLSVLCVVGWLDSRKWWWAVAAGFVGGLAALTRGELVALIPLSIAVVLAASRGELGRGGFKSRAQALMPAAAVAAAAISVMAPWWATTAYLTDSPTLTATGGAGHIAYGACPDTFYRDDFAYSSINCVFPRTAYFPFDELAAAGVTSKNTVPLDPAGTEFIKDHLSAFPAVMSSRLGRSLGLYLPEDQAQRSQNLGEAPAGIGRFVWAEWAVLCMLAIPGAVALWHRSRARLLVLGCSIAPTLAAIALGVGYTRYRTVVLPLIIMLAAAGLATVSTRRVSRNVGVAMLALGSLFMAGRVAEAAGFDPIRPTEPPTPLADEFGGGPRNVPDVVIGPIDSTDRAAISNYRNVLTRQVRLSGGTPAQIVDAPDRCADRFTVFHPKSQSHDDIVVGFRNESNYTIVRSTGPHAGWQVVEVRNGDERVVKSSAAPNRSGWVTVQAGGPRVVLSQQGTPLIWFDVEAPITNVGIEGTAATRGQAWEERSRVCLAG